MEKLLGDMTEDALKKIGADKLVKFYERKTGKACNCAGRKQMLNNLHRAAQRMAERQLSPAKPKVAQLPQSEHKLPTKPVDE